MKKEKYQQIFKYLLEFSKIRSNPVRDIEYQDTHYPERFWFSEIPEDSLFDNVIRQNFNPENEFWIKVKKPKEPEKPVFPAVSKTLNPWIEYDSLMDDAEEPILKETIEINGKILTISDFADVQREYEKYINSTWIDDLITYKTEYSNYEKEFEIFEMQNNIYKRLFRIYNKAQQFGEEYELIVGVGLLNFKENTESHKIFRHVLTQRAEINFEYTERDSHIIVCPTIESLPIIETDAIIDLIEQFDSQNIIDAEKEVENFIREKGTSSIFNEELKDAIQIFADRFSPEGKFIDTIERPNSTEKRPTVFYSPALLLRKRNTRSYTALYENILENLEDESDEIEIPTMDDLIEIQDKPFNESDREASNNFSSNFEAIYFPKEHNEEQKKIIEKAKKSNKVLVQGPPGTGKSHTIANLICHLLATGNKVLITAYTKRALEVLKAKLPVEFQNLAVNFLSGDSSSIQDLEASVNAISDELSHGDLKQYLKEIEELNVELEIIKEEIAKTSNELLRIKEKSTRKQEILPEYTGTLTQIAEILEKESTNFIWFTDLYSKIEDNEIVGDLRSFIQLHNLYKTVDITEFEKWLPEITYLPTVKELSQYRNAKETYYEICSSKESHKIDCPDYELLNKKLEEILELYNKFSSTESKLAQNLQDSYFQGNSYQWDHKIEQSAIILSRIQEIDLNELKYNVRVNYNSTRDLVSLKNDAKILLDFLNQGNTLSGVTFKVKKALLPKEIKEKLYFIESVQVNSSPCDTKKEFEIVLNDIELKQDFLELSDIWETDTIPKSSTYDKKFLFYKNYHSEAIRLISIIKKIKQLSTEIEQLIKEKITAFDKAQIENLIRLTQLSNLQDIIERSRKIVSNSEKYLSKSNSHPITSKLILNLQQIDPISYELTLKELDTINEGISQYHIFRQLESKLRKDIPNLIDKILNDEFNISQLPEFSKALRYRYTKNRIHQLFDINYEKQLFTNLKDYDRKEKNLIAKIASKLAWKYVIEELQNNRALRQYLEAWVQAVKKIGKTGKGKRALKFRKEAQIQMEKCKSAVPCWIMPLYKVAETIQPEQGMYDYVIIDEASQLGPDAIFLLYISKNIIIVGADKQTSPEYVGVDANTMSPHISKYLKGIPFANYYGTEFSFFDHARRFCDGITVLREHFRCMPEIIEFSNKHFYARDNIGLYPLKQYSENRLEPLQSVFCHNGYVDGSGSRIINQPEAQAIVDKIAEIIKDEKYKGKSIGVIALQGNLQASIIESLLMKNIGELEFHKRKIICGNSASFQGDERDIIFLSLVTGQKHNRAALTKPEDERRFNVAVSRAKEQIWLFHSVEMDDLSNKDDLRFKLLDHFKNPISKPPVLNKPYERRPGTQPEPFDSWFEVDVYNDIVNKGYSVIPQYAVAKGRYIIDLVALFPNGTKIAVECDGDIWHGADQYQNDLMRQKVLERCGWQFFRIRGFEYYSDRKKALEPLWEIFSKFESQKDSKEEENTYSSTNDTNESDEKHTKKEQSNSNQEEKEISQIENIVEVEGQGIERVVRYLNLFSSGIYTLTEENPLQADFVIPIKSNQKKGFLLQCYESGHINKVFISVLLSRKIGKKYMNGLNTNDKLIKVTVIEAEKIIGIYFTENGEKKFKAHLTENISCREQLHLQGYKVIYNDYEQIDYKILPIEIKEDINRLVFNSFTANGKPISNNYYEKEWTILKKFDSKTVLASTLNTKEDNLLILEKESPRNRTLFDKQVKEYSTVKIRYIKENKILTIQFVDYETKGKDISMGVQKLYNRSPLAYWIMGKCIGDRIQLGNTDNYIEILEIL